MISRYLQRLCVLGIAGFFGACDQITTPPGATSDAPVATAPDKVQTAQAPPDGPKAVVEPIRDDLRPISLLIANDRTGPARVQLRNYLQLHPNDSQATFLFGLSYHREKKYGEAVEHFDRALEAKAPYRTTNHFRGWALFYLGELDESRRAFLAFLESQPDEPDSHYALGLIALDEGDLDEAARLFQRCFELAERDNRQAKMKLLSKARYGLGRVHEQKGELEQAKTEFARSVELFPDHYEALYRLNRVLVKLGEDEQAAIVQERYLQTKERVRPGTSFPE